MLLFDVVSVRLEHLSYLKNLSNVGHFDRKAASISNQGAEIQIKGFQTQRSTFILTVVSKETGP